MKFIILLLITFCMTSIQAQSKLSFGISSGYLYNYRLITKSGSDLYRNYRNSNETYLPGFNIELLIGKKYNDRFKIETGIGYSENGYSTKEKIIIDPGFSPLTAGFKSELYHYTNRNYYIPFHLIYETTRKLNFQVSAGPSVVFPVSNKVEWILRKEFGMTDEQMIYHRNNESHTGKIGLMFDIGLGIGFRFTEKLNITFLPRIYYDLIGNENTDIRDNLYYINMFNNKDKTTREHLISYGLTFGIVYDL